MAKEDETKASGREKRPAASETAPEDARPYRVQLESYGWLASGSTAGKRAKVIEGVGGATALGLKAQLYSAQEAARQRGPGIAAPSAREIAALRDPYARKNRGLEERMARDDAARAAEDKEATYRSNLERKAALYERLASGAAADGDGGEASARFEVDFLAKSFKGNAGAAVGESSWRDAGGDAWDGDGWGGSGVTEADGRRMVSRAGVRGRAGLGDAAEGRAAWERDEAERAVAAEARAEEERQRRVQLVREVGAETAEGRARAAELRRRQQDERSAKRERLKAMLIERRVAEEKAKLEQESPGVIVELTKPAPAPDSREGGGAGG